MVHGIVLPTLHQSNLGDIGTGNCDFHTLDLNQQKGAWADVPLQFLWDAHVVTPHE